MIEATLAVALVALGAGTIVTAVLSVAHEASHGQSVAALTLSAQNVVADLRAATAYDPQILAGLAGRTIDFIAREPSANGSPAPVHVHVRVTGGQTAATVWVTAGNEHGDLASVEGTLRAVAPAPGSVVPAAVPSSSPPEGAAMSSTDSRTPCRLPETLCNRSAGPIPL